MKKIFTLLFLLASFSGFSQSTTIVLSQVYGGGGGASGTYKYDYVELHNVSNTTQSLDGMSLQYGSATGNFGNSSSQIFAIPNGTTIAAGKYLLIQLGNAGTGGADFPVPADLTSGNLLMGAASGKVALVSQTTGMGCGATATPCTLTNPPFIDVVSYGASNNGEGGTTVNNGTALTSTQGCVRKNNGCTDTDNNNNDFDVVTAPVPRNSASPAFSCSGGATPSISLSTLTSFGNVCINTTAGPNSFTITGANLTNANVNVAALAGYTYSTTAGGTYTTTLSLTQPGGAYTQQVFVNFNPTAVQSYNGNIAVSGGGVSTAVNAAAVGSGVNSAPTVTTGSASSITQTTATAAGTITDIGCSAITAYGIAYSTVNGFPLGGGSYVASSNLSGGNFSSNLTGLSIGTTYYYRAFAANSADTAYGAQQSFTTASASPTITATPLATFGNICINTTVGPNSFTINGTNLTNANVTVAALAGYTYATTSGGTYTTTLSLTQPGGTYAQQIFVKFNPTAVQSYNGNIAVSGGGVSTAVNVAAAGAGVNTMATAKTGAASGITQTSAILSDSITNIGCSAVTAYGNEYSTTNNFTPGTGIQVASSNLSAGGFNSNLTGLTAATTYYYRAYATNSGGTAYGAQMSFTTAAPTLSVSALTSFGNTCVNNSVGPNSFTVSGVGLSNANINIGPLAGYSFATTSGGTYTASLSLTQPGGAYNQTIYVKFTPTAVQSYTGSIPVNGGGATATTVAADGTGVNTLATVITGSSSNINNNAATLAGSIANNGCSSVTAYGIELSGINGFVGGTGTKYPSGNIATGSFSVNLNNLVQGTTYYYKAYATNNGGTSYGLQQSFTVASIGSGFMVYPSPAQKGAAVRVAKDNLKPGFYGVLFYNSEGQLVYQYNMNIQSNFINQSITLPSALVSGMYRVTLVNNDKVLSVKTIQIF
ncbi:MAG: lamin tail domain-containing protein [Bacteroidetes bacterium]|nr:lamin tail domain-containing protein [Bacteroidota bacterium]